LSAIGFVDFNTNTKAIIVEYCEIKAVENLGCQQGDSLLGVGVDHYIGAGRFADPELQSRILL